MNFADQDVRFIYKALRALQTGESLSAAEMKALDRGLKKLEGGFFQAAADDGMEHAYKELRDEMIQREEEREREERSRWKNESDDVPY